MDFKQPNSQKLQDTGALLAGAVAGGMVSRGIYGVIQTNTVNADAATAKSEQTMGYVKRAGLIVASLYAASGMNGTDMATTGAKGALYGVAVTQALDLVKDYSATTTAGATAAAGTTAKDQFVARALGLGCPCDAPASLGRPRNGRNRRLRMPMIELPQQAQLVDASNANSLEARLSKGQLKSA